MQPTKEFNRYPYLPDPFRYVDHKPFEPKEEDNKITFDQFLDEVVFTGRTRREHYRVYNTDVDMLRRIWNIAIEKGIK